MTELNEAYATLTDELDVRQAKVELEAAWTFEETRRRLERRIEGLAVTPNALARRGFDPPPFCGGGRQLADSALGACAAGRRVWMRLWRTRSGAGRSVVLNNL